MENSKENMHVDIGDQRVKVFSHLQTLLVTKVRCVVRIPVTDKTQFLQPVRKQNYFTTKTGKCLL